MTPIAEFLLELGVSVEGAKEAEKQLEGVEGAAEDVEKEGGGALQGFAKIAGTALAATAVAVTAAAAAIVAAGKQVFDFVAETTNAIDKMGEEAEKTGLGVEQYQRLGYAAEKTGTNIETVIKAGRKLGTGLAEAAAGGKTFETNLNAIGLTASDLAGLDLSGQLGKIGDALNLYTNEAERGALASKLLGEEGGPQLALLLKGGTEGLEALKAAAGEVFTDEDVEKSAALTDQLEEFDKIVAKAQGDLAVALAPAIEGIAKRVTEWVTENDDFIKQDLPKIIEGIANALVDLLPIVVDVIEGFQGFAKEIRDLDSELTHEFGPAWDVVKTSVQAVLFPILAVAKAIGAVIDTIKEFVASSETLMGLARDFGIGAFEKTTNVRGAAANSQETEEERVARIQDEQLKDEEFRELARAKEDEAIDDERRRKKYGEGFVSKTILGAKGRKFTELERSALEGMGKTDAEIDRFEQSNVRRAPKGKAGKAGKKEKEKVEVHLTDFEQALMAVSKPGFELKNLGSIKTAKLKAEDIKPETAITVINNNFDIDQEIHGQTDAKAIGDAAIAAAKREINITLARAAQGSQTNVER